MALCFATLDADRHDRERFTCGVDALDEYLRLRASQHQRSGIATTHVLVDENDPGRILAYCSLSAAQLHLHELSAEDRKRLPAYPVPAVRLGRLAVSQSEQGKGFGRMMVGHAVNVARSVRKSLGVRVLIVDAKNARTATFYEAFGFRRTASAALTLYLTIV